MSRMNAVVKKGFRLPLCLVSLFCVPIWHYSDKANNVVESVWRIYNESPIRQNRGFPHYGESMEMVAASLKGSFDGLDRLVYVYPGSRVCVSKKCDRCCKQKHFGNGVFK